MFPCGIFMKNPGPGMLNPLKQQFPTFLAPGTGFMEDNFLTGVGGAKDEGVEVE